MSTYTTGDIAKRCHVSVRTVQYYDRQGILRPSQMSDANRRVYTDEEVKKLKLIIVLKELGCSLKDIKLLLRNEETLKTLSSMLKVKEDELQQDIGRKENVVKRIKEVRKYFNKTSISPITHLYDIDHIMKESLNLKSIRKKLWLATGIVGIIQYTGLVASIVTKEKEPFLSVTPVTIVYALVLTYYYKNNVSYLCPNCQNVFNPKTLDFIKAQHTPKTRKLTCPDCHETHFCIEVPKNEEQC